MEKKTKNWTKWIYWFSFAVAVIAVYKTLDNFNDILSFIKNLFGVLMPFFMGLLLAYLFYTPSKKLERLYSKSKILKKFSRQLAVFSVYIIAIICIIILFNVVLPAVSTSVAELTGNLPAYYESLINYINEMPEDSIISKDTIMDTINNIKNIDFASYFSTERIIEYVKGMVSVAQGVFSVFVTIIMSIYILLQRADILKFIKKATSALFKDSTYKSLGKYFSQSNQVFFKFISSQIIDGIIVGIITSIAMLIMGVKYAVLLGFMIGLFNIIPYFGAIVAVGITILITWITGGLSQAIWVAVIIIILQQIDANIINPKIVGDSLSLSPILVIFAVTVGGAYFGFLGMLLAVPVIAVLKILICDYIDYKNARKKLAKTD